MDRKIQAASIAAMATTMTLWLLGYFAPELMDTAPVGLESGITGGLTVFIGWVIPEKKGGKDVRPAP